MNDVVKALNRKSEQRAWQWMNSQYLILFLVWNVLPIAECVCVCVQTTDSSAKIVRLNLVLHHPWSTTRTHTNCLCRKNRYLCANGHSGTYTHLHTLVIIAVCVSQWWWEMSSAPGRTFSYRESREERKETSCITETTVVCGAKDKMNNTRQSDDYMCVKHQKNRCSRLTFAHKSLAPHPEGPDSKVFT